MEPLPIAVHGLCREKQPVDRDLARVDASCVQKRDLCTQKTLWEPKRWFMAAGKCSSNTSKASFSNA